MKAMLTSKQLMEHQILLHILLTYDPDNLDRIRNKDNSVYGQATREVAIEQGISVSRVDNTLLITISKSSS